MKTIDFYFDFASPNFYLAHQLIPGIEERTGVTFNYMPILLGGVFKTTGNQAPFMAFQGIPNKMNYMHVEFRRFIRMHGIQNFKMNSNFPLNTVTLMRGALVAEEDGRLMDYIEAVSKAVWQDDINPADPDALGTVLASAGFDPAAMFGRIQDGAIKQKLIDNTGAAAERGVFGIPTFFLDDEIFFGKETLRDIETLVTS